MRAKSSLVTLVVVPILAIFLGANSTDANDSFGSWGGSWGASSGLFGSRGGPIRNLLAAAPVRTTLRNVAGRVAGWGSSGGGSFGGGSFGSGGSCGGGSFGSRGSFGGSRGWGSGGSRGFASRGFGSTGSSSFGSGSTGFGGSTGFSGSTGFGGSTGYSSNWGVSSVGSGFNCPSSGILSPPSFASAPPTAINSGVISSPGFSTTAPFQGSFGSPIETSFESSTILPGHGFADPSYIDPTSQPLYDPSSVPSVEIFANPGVNSVLGPLEDPGSQPGGIQGIQPEGPFGTPPSGFDNEPTPGSDDVTTRSKRLKKSKIKVRLPDEAKVYVNGKLTKSSGELRSFVSSNQKPGSKYRYEVAAVLNGQRQVKEFTMHAGETKSIGFDFSAVTTVAVQVPEDAKVVLAGNATKSSGVERKFKTKTLTEGEKWDDYTVTVTVVRDGKKIVREKTIDVIGGQTYALNFDFDDVDASAVASNK